MSLVPNIDKWIFSTYSQKYDDLCDCSTSFLCSSPALIYDNNETFNVNGFRIGCFVVESLLSSSLECIYNASCLREFLQHVQLNSTSILQSSNKFNRTDSIEMLLNALMVEQWHNFTDYKAYFVACQVKTCSYSFEGHRSLLSIATTMLGLIGGLVTILMFIIPILATFVRKKKQVQIISSKYILAMNQSIFIHLIKGYSDLTYTEESVAYPGEGQMGNCPAKILEDRLSRAKHFEKVALPKPCPSYF